MIKWNKNLAIRWSKRVGLVYLGLVLGAGLLYLDNRAWLVPMKEVNQYKADIEKHEKAQTVDGTELDRCLSLRDTTDMNSETVQCLLQSESKMTTGYGRALLAGYMSIAGVDRDIRIRLLSQSIKDIRRERELPWNKLMREARYACDRTVLPCLAQDLRGTADQYQRLLATLGAELAKLTAEGE